MGYIPEDAEWYIADLIMEITVNGSELNVVHRNLMLIRAKLPEEAYEKAIKLGKEEETSYENPKGQLVEIRFRGIAKLDVIYEPLEDGSEIAYEEFVGMSEEHISSMIPDKSNLYAFIPHQPGRTRDPDYSSRAIVELAVKMGPKKREL